MTDSPSDVTDLFANLSVCRSLVKEAKESLTAIRLQTTGFEITADCDLGGRRLSELLNQEISDYLECTNAVLYRGGKRIDRVQHLKIRKPEIMLAGIIGDTHEAPEKRIGSRRRLEQFDAFVAIDRWIVRGRLYLTCHKSVKEFLHANCEFFPIADATIMDAESPDEPVQTSVAIVNRFRVSFMEIAESPRAEIASERSSVSLLLKSITDEI